MSETQRSLVRIVSNYARLFSTLCLGLLWAPLLLRCVADDAFGLIAFLGTNAGLADRIRGVISRSMVRELGAAYHDDDPNSFLKAYNCAMAVCLGAGVLTLLLHGVLIAVLPLFPVSEGLLAAGCWFVVAKGIESFFTVVMAPIFNFYLIDERMPTFNFWMVAIRGSNVIVAIGMVWVMPLSDGAEIGEVSRNVITYGFLSATVATLVLGGAVAYLVFTDERFRIQPSLVDRAGIKSIVAVGGWNSAMVLATGTYVPAAGVFMYAYFGSVGGRIFGIAMPLTFYVRMLATGMAAGLDAVSARVTAGKSTVSLSHVIFQSTRLNGLIVFPAILFITTMSEPIIDVWVGHQLKYRGEVTMTANLVKALALGAIAMGVSEAWITIMYGAGHIKKIAPMILLGLVASCLITPVGVLLAPEAWSYLTPAICASLSIGATMFVGTAIVVARVIDVSLREIATPLVRPLIASLLALPCLVPFLIVMQTWTLPRLLLVSLAYSLSFLAVAWVFALEQAERKRIRESVRLFFSSKNQLDSQGK